MKRIILILLLCLPMMAGAQTYSEIQTRLNANIWQDGTRFQTNSYRRFYTDTLNSLLNDMLDFTNGGFLPLTFTTDQTVNAGGNNLDFIDVEDMDFTSNNNGWWYWTTQGSSSRIRLRAINSDTTNISEILTDYTKIQLSKTRGSNPYLILQDNDVLVGAGTAATFGGLKYNGNYHNTMTTDFYVPDIGWVKGYVDTAAVGGTSYTFENGLTESGGTVKLGGDLTQDTNIDLRGDLEGTSGNREFKITLNNSEDYWFRLKGGDPFENGENLIDIKTAGGRLWSDETFSGGLGGGAAWTFQGQSGIRYYDEDYGSSFSNASLVHKKYVDSRAKLSKYDATAAPGTGDDAADGYSVGSIWCDVTNDDAYICLDSTNGAAVWKKITP